MSEENQSVGYGSRRLYGKITQTVFTVMEEMEFGRKDSAPSLWLVKVRVVVDVLQLLGLAFNPHVGWSLAWFPKIVYFFLLSSVWDPAIHSLSYNSAAAFFWITVSVLVVLFCLLVSFFKAGIDNRRVNTVARYLLHSITGPFLWPFMHILLAQMVCRPSEYLWLHDDVECFADTLFDSMFVVGLLSFAFLCVMSYLALASIYESDPFGRHPLARAHSRLDVVEFAFKVGSALAYHLLLSRGMVQEYTFIITATTFVMALAYSVVLPYFSRFTTYLRVATLLITSWASLVLYIARKDESGTGMASGSTDLIVFAAGSPVPLLAAWYLSRVRISQECMDGLQKIFNGSGGPVTAGVFPDYLPSNDQHLSLYNDLETWITCLETYDDVEPPELLSPYVNSIWLPSDVELSTRFLRAWQDQICMTPTNRMLAFASRIYTKGLLRYKNSPLIHVHFAGFLLQFLERSQFATSFLESLEQLDGIIGSFPDRYIVYRTCTRLKANLGIRDRSHSQGLAYASRLHRESLEQMWQFWARLVDQDHISLMGLALLANKITEKRERAKSSFKAVLLQNSNDLQALGQFANFLLHVMMDQQLYDECKEEIRSIQESRKRGSKSVKYSEGSSMASTISRAQNGVSATVARIIRGLEAKLSGESGSRTIQVLQITIRVIFTPLVLLLVGNFLLSYYTAQDHTKLISQAGSAGQVRALSQYLALVLQQLIAAVVAGAKEGSPTVVLLQDKLKAAIRSFEAHHNRLTYGEEATNYAPLQSYYTKDNLEVKIFTSETESVTVATSLWSLGNTWVTYFYALASEPVSSLPDSKYTKTIEANVARSVSHDFDTAFKFSEEQERDILQTASTASIILFTFAVLMVVVVYLMFVWNFNKITESKLSTLELFTRIPLGALKSTAEEARKKYLSFDKDLDDTNPDFTFEGSQMDLAKRKKNSLKDLRRLKGSTSMPPQGSEKPLEDSLRNSMNTYLMTEEEAINSLSERKQSVVAMLLAKGCEESKELERELRERDHKLSSAMNMNISVNVSEDLDAAVSAPQKELQMNSAARPTISLVSQAQRRKEQSSLLRVMVFYVAVLVIASVAISETIILSRSTDLHDEVEKTRAAIDDVYRLRDRMDATVGHARSYSQFGRRREYESYKDLQNQNMVDRYLLKLQESNPEEGGDVLEEVASAWETLSHAHDISMALTAQYYGRSEALELSWVTWSERNITDRRFLEQYRDLTMRFTQLALRGTEEDSQLPNALLLDKVETAFRHARHTAEVLHLTFLAQRQEPHPQGLKREAEVRKWQEDREALAGVTDEERADRLLGVLTGPTTSGLSAVVEDGVAEAYMAVLLVWAKEAGAGAVSTAAPRLFSKDEMGKPVSSSAWWAAARQHAALIARSMFQGETRPYATGMEDSLQRTRTELEQLEADLESKADLFATLRPMYEAVKRDITELEGRPSDPRYDVLRQQLAVHATDYLASLHNATWSVYGDVQEVLSAKAALGRLVVFDDFYTVNLRRCRDALGRLRTSFTQHKERVVTWKLQDVEHLAIVCMTLYAVIGAFALLAVAVYRQWRIFIIAAFAFAAFALVLDLNKTAEAVEEAHSSSIHIQILHNESKTNMAYLREAALNYVQFGDGLHFEKYWSKFLSEDIEHVDSQFLSAGNFADSDDKLAHEKRLRAVRREFEEQGAMERTALVLAQNAFGGAELLQQLKVLEKHTWDFETEEGQAMAVILFPDDKAQRYTNTRDDLYCLTCTPHSIAQKARAVLVSQRYNSHVVNIETYLEKSKTKGMGAWDEEVSDKQTRFELVSSLAISAGCIIIAVTCVCGILVLLDVLHKSTAAVDRGVLTEMGHQLFSNMTRSCRIALVGVVVLLVILFVVVYTGSVQSENVVRKINLASARQWLSMKSLYISIKVSQGGPENEVLQHDLRRVVKRLHEVNFELYFGPGGREGFLSEDSTQDHLLFGATHQRSRQELAELYAQCPTTSGGTASVRSEMLPVDDLYHYFLSRVKFIAYSSDQEAVRKVLDDILFIRDPLFQRLKLSTERYRSISQDVIKANILWCTIVVVTTILFIMAEYRFIFAPMISQLVTEEEGTKLMLNMIPPEIREGVPEIAEFFSTGKVDADEKMKRQLQQSEKLLQNILPPAISRRLKAGEHLIADDHTRVTVSFSSLVGFDELSKNMTAYQIVTFLNDLFSRFDEITDRLDLEKIKTIGDIYFMCGGLTEKTASDHAVRVVHALLLFFDACSNHNTRYNTQLKLKAGVNTGPAVAGVIGSKKVAYDLWGDAVNVASRLCGTGQAGKIAVFSTTYALVQEYYSFHTRVVQAKGKGELLTYVLDEQIAPTPFSQ